VIVLERYSIVYLHFLLICTHVNVVGMVSSVLDN